MKWSHALTLYLDSEVPFRVIDRHEEWYDAGVSVGGKMYRPFAGTGRALVSGRGKVNSDGESESEDDGDEDEVGVDLCLGGSKKVGDATYFAVVDHTPFTTNQNIDSTTRRPITPFSTPPNPQPKNNRNR